MRRSPRSADPETLSPPSLPMTLPTPVGSTATSLPTPGAVSLPGAGPGSLDRIDGGWPRAGRREPGRRVRPECGIGREPGHSAGAAAHEVASSTTGRSTLGDDLRSGRTGGGPGARGPECSRGRTGPRGLAVRRRRTAREPGAHAGRAPARRPGGPRACPRATLAAVRRDGRRPGRLAHAVQPAREARGRRDGGPGRRGLPSVERTQTTRHPPSPGRTLRPARAVLSPERRIRSGAPAPRVGRPAIV